MSTESPFFSQALASSDDMDAWFCMLNSMVNFLSAASTLATKLEQNYLLRNVTELKRPAYPLLRSPPSCKKIEHMHIAETSVKSSTNELRFMEQTFISPSQPESEYHGETSDLTQEVRYMNTQDKGDGGSIDSGEGGVECNSIEEVVQSVADDIQDPISYEDQFEETIKICDSEDTIYFDDITYSERTIDYQEPSNQITEMHDKENINHSPNVEKDGFCSASSSFLENKSVQAKCKNNDNLSNCCKNKVKSIKSEEIQTNSTCRFKSTVRALITKSPELQQSIRDSIISHISSTYEKAPNSCKHSAVPKNLNELKEQLDSIKNKSNSKTSVNENKPRCQKSKIPVDKTSLRKPKKLEKQPSNSSNANQCVNNVPPKYPGTSKRFASVESVVKKLIHSKVSEKKTDETIDNAKTYACIHKNVSKPQGSKQSITKSPGEHVEKNVHLPKDCKVVKDFIYKKPATHKSEKSKVINEQSKFCRKQNETLTQNQSRTMSLKSPRNSSTMEMIKKKEKSFKRTVSPNKVIKEKNTIVM